MHDYQESVTTGQTDSQTDRRMDRQTPDKVIPMCRYASQATHQTLFLQIFGLMAIIDQNENDNNDNLCKVHGDLYIALALISVR